VKFQEIVERTRALAERPARPLEPQKRARIFEEFVARTAARRAFSSRRARSFPGVASTRGRPATPTRFS
jgi:hypothetical protein